MDIILAPRGAARRTIALADIQVPDAWHAAMRLLDHDEETMSKVVIETWHLANDLLDKLREIEKEREEDTA